MSNATPDRTVKPTGGAREILDAYRNVHAAPLPAVAANIQNSNPLISYYSIRRASRDNILGADVLRSLLKSNNPLIVSASLAGAHRALGAKTPEAVAPFLRESHPSVLEAALDAMEENTSHSDAGKILLEALPKLPTAQRHRTIRILAKWKYRPAAAAVEEMFQRRDASDAPVACRAMATIQGRSFLDSITEYLYPDNPIELHEAILECMAENPLAVYYVKASQLLKTLRHKQAIIEVVRRLALWSPQGLDLALTLMANSDVTLAEAAQEGVTRHLRAVGNMPPGLLQRLGISQAHKDATNPSPADQVPLPPHIDQIEEKLNRIFTSKPDSEFQQLFFMTIAGEKHFLKPKLVQLAAVRWGDDDAAVIDAALQLSHPESQLLQMRLQTRWAAQAEQQTQSMALARLIESIGNAGMKSAVKEIVKHLDTPALPVQMAAVSALSDIGGAAEAAEIERRISMSHWMLRRKIAGALAHLTAQNPTPALFKLCEDSEPLVRIAAIRALDGIPNTRSYTSLLTALSDADERVRSAAAAGLRHFASQPGTQEKLVEMLKDRDARVRANTVESLEVILAADAPELIRVLKPLLSDPNARVVINTAKAIFQYEPGTSLPVLEAYLKAPDTNLRAGALWALGQLRRPDAFLCLHYHSLKETDKYVRTFVDRGIHQMKDHPFYQDSKYVFLSHSVTSSK